MGPALQWRQWDDRNDEFWGHQFWVGENPPTQAVIQMYFKKPLTDVKLKITDALGKQVRDLPIPANRLQAGIQTVCWDMRVDPIVAGAPAGGRPAGGARGRRGGRGRRRRRPRAAAAQAVAAAAVAAECRSRTRATCRRIRAAEPAASAAAAADAAAAAAPRRDRWCCRAPTTSRSSWRAR